MSRLPRSMLAAGTAVASLLIIAPSGAVASQGPKLVPFHGTYAGSYRAQVAPPNVIITATGGVGHATHLGRFELTNVITVGLQRGPVPNCPVPGTTEVYTATLTAANGDTITLEGTGTGCQTSPTTVAVVDTVTITGGTGRFEGASGDLTVTSAVDQAERTVVISFDGTMSSPGSTK